jgi:hypothetical protein
MQLKIFKGAGPARAYEADPDKRRDLLQEIHFALWRSFRGLSGSLFAAHMGVPGRAQTGRPRRPAAPGEHAETWSVWKNSNFRQVGGSERQSDRLPLERFFSWSREAPDREVMFISKEWTLPQSPKSRIPAGNVRFNSPQQTFWLAVFMKEVRHDDASIERSQNIWR